MKIDSHQHFWKYDPVRDSWINDEMSVIKGDFLPEDLQPILKENNVDGCVAVQADQSETETEFLLSLADANDFIKGVVGWVDLTSDDLEDRLAYFSTFPRLKGFRHIVQGQPAGFMLNPRFIEGVKKLSSFGFTYDLLIYHFQLEEAISFLRKVDDAKIVVDHIAKPSIATGEITPWDQHMKMVAQFPNVSCKISGMVTEGNWKSWTNTDFHPYIDTVLDAFGPSRLMYGSDWPVCLVAGTYSDQMMIVKEHLSKLTGEERSLVFGLNAQKFYNL